ncbi:MAG: hypothetical protein IID28_00040 [Planctomycetes bacterium]|nr:hypothetical protein [Planctomycetota bacterium]
MPEPRGLLLARLVATLAVAFSGRPVVAVESCSPGDLDLDGFVGIVDMLAMLGRGTQREVTGTRPSGPATPGSR